MEKRTQKERRAESDVRILTSAIRLFGRDGYTHTSIADIAKEAGVTGPLISQRFSSKEMLFLATYLEAIKNVFSEVDRTASPRDCLYSIIGDIEKLCDNAPEIFDFCSMLHNTSDYPKDILKPHQEEMKQATAYEILKNAQKQGILPEGNLDALLAAFGAMVFHNVGLRKHHHLEYVEPERFLEFIRFSDAKSMRQAKWNRIFETAIANTFDFLIYVNIADNTGEVLKSSDAYSVYGDYTDIRQAIEKTIEENVPEEEKDKVREYFNMDTLGARLKGRKSVSLKSRQKDGSVLIHSFLPITWDDAGNLTEAFSGVYRVQSDGMPE